MVQYSIKFLDTHVTFKSAQVAMALPCEFEQTFVTLKYQVIDLR